jgi:hypothetical protein
MGTKIDLEQLSRELQNLRPEQKLYIVLKRGLKKYITGKIYHVENISLSLNKTDS